MNLAIVTCLWKRPELTEVVAKYYYDNFPGIKKYRCRTPSDLHSDNNYGWITTSASNEVLAQKFNRVFETARNLNPMQSF